MNYSVVNDPENGYGLVAQGEIEGDPLDESIRKWEFVVQWVEENHKRLDEDGINTCALCISVGCYTCPVRARTGKMHCMGSPYYAYWGAAPWQKALEAAKAELAFLKSIKE